MQPVRRLQRARIPVADTEVVVEQVAVSGGRIVGLQATHQRAAAAVQPAARSRRAGFAGQRADREGAHHVDRLLRFVQRRLQQGGRDLHRKRGADHHQRLGRFAQARRGLQCDQRAQAVPSQRRALHARRLEQGHDPVRQRLDAAERRALAAAVTRQVHGQHRMAVMRQLAALQGPHAVVVERAVDQHHRRQRHIKRLATGVGIGTAAVDVQVHDGRPGKHCLVNGARSMQPLAGRLFRPQPALRQ